MTEIIKTWPEEEFMDSTVIETRPAEASLASVAPHRLRIAAFLVDLAIIATLSWLMPPTYYSALLNLAIFVAYHTWLPWLAQQTPGKALCGLRLERIGAKPSFLWCLGRASGYLTVDLFGAGILCALFNSDHGCLHDRVFGSRVVYEGAGKFELRVLLTRLINYGERLKAAEEGETVSKLSGLWTRIAGVAATAREGLDRLHAAVPKVSFEASKAAMRLKTALAVSAISSAVTVGAAVYVPPVTVAADWLLTPQVSRQPPDDWGVCSCPDDHLFIGVIYKGQRWHGSGYACPAK